MGLNFNTFKETDTILKLIALIFLWFASFMIATSYYSRNFDNFMVVSAAGGTTIESLLILLRVCDKPSGKESEGAYGLVWGVFCIISAVMAILSKNDRASEYFLALVFFAVAGVLLLVDSVMSIMKK